MKDLAGDLPEQAVAAKSEDRILRLSQVFDATRETLFAAFTDPKILVCWWGPEGATIPECRVDLRVGGRWRTCLQGTSCDDHCVGGVYREIRHPEKLVFTWAWETANGPGEETLITLEFFEHDEGCELQFTQEGFTERGVRDSHSKGWKSSLVCLRNLLTGEDAVV